MQYCSTCLQPDSRPGIKFKLNRCPACQFKLESDDFDWESRISTLKQVFDLYRSRSRSNYDCIIGVSGGKDSTRQALWARDFFGLNPLLVAVSYPPEQISQRGIENLNNLLELGFDFYTSAPSPISWKKLMKTSFLNHANWAKSTELALFAGVPQIAIELGIPLILWGENPALQIGDLGTMGKYGWDGNRSRFMNTLIDVDETMASFAGVSTEKFLPYIYPNNDSFQQHGLQIVYLGWAMKTWGLMENGISSLTTGLEPRLETPKYTGDLLSVSSLDEDWVVVNQMIKYYKFGFGKTTEYVNELIRTNRISRSDGIKIVEKFDGNCSDSYIISFCKYIDITVSFFWDIVNSHVNTNLFEIRRNRRPRKLFKVGESIK
jgi:N-acetyl sugar amidotransferase